MSFKTDDPDRKITSTGSVELEGNQMCFTDTVKGRNCVTIYSEEVLQMNKGEIGWMMPGGEIEWVHGYSTKMKEDPCKKE